MDIFLKPHNLVDVTIIYYSDQSVELEYQYVNLHQHNGGRVIIPESFKRNKSIVAVCEGKVNILNKLGERVTGEPNIDYNFTSKNYEKKSCH